MKRRLMNFAYYFAAIITCDMVQLSNHRWFRRMYGGHWEQWRIDFPVVSDMWLDLPHCYKASGERPGLGRGTPTCENY